MGSPLRRSATKDKVRHPARWEIPPPVFHRDVVELERAMEAEACIVALAEKAGVETGSALRATCRTWRRRVDMNADDFVGWTISVLVLVVGGNVGTALQQVKTLQTAEYLDVATRLWRPLPAMHSPRFSPAVANLGEEVFVFGGLSNGTALNTAEVLNVKSQEWTPLPRMHTARLNPTVVHADGWLYVLGGLSDGELIRKVERLSVAARDRWEMCEPVPETRTQAGTARVGGWIVVVGGLRYSLASEACDGYDLATGHWQPLPPMRHCRVNPQVATVGNRLLVAGGRGGLELTPLQAVDIFDAATQVWASLPDLPQPYHSPGICVAGERFFTFGGDLKGIPSKDCYVLDLAEPEKWTKLPDMDIGVSSPLIVPVGPHHFIVLGGYSLSKFKQLVQYFKSEKSQWNVWASSDAQMGAPRIGAGYAQVSVVPQWARKAGYVRRELRAKAAPEEPEEPPPDVVEEVAKAPSDQSSDLDFLAFGAKRDSILSDDF